MSYHNWHNPDEDDEFDNEELSEDVDWGGKDGVIFLIDATESMFREDEQHQEGESEVYFRKALKCCHMTMLKKIMGSEKDLIAVVLFGTAKKENHLDLNNLYVLQSLEQPNIEKIRTLDKMIKTDSCGNFGRKYGHSNDYILQDALWLCQSIFSSCEQKMGLQRILLFTANDDPHTGNRTEQQRAFDRANDLRGLNITLELLPLGANFNINSFYKELVEMAVGEEYAEQALVRCEQNIEELLVHVCRYNHKKRSQGRQLFYLGSGVAIGVAIYGVLRRRPMPRRVWLESTTNLAIKPATHEFNADTGEVILPMDIMKFKECGGQKIVFNPEETKSSKALEPGFYFMGCKPQEEVRLDHYLQKHCFIIPDENQVKGSRKLFAALLKRCEERKLVILCFGVVRQGSAPKLFGLFPQKEEYNSETGAQEKAGGFCAYPLPTCGNFRSLEVEPLDEATKEQNDVMIEVMSKLTFRYNVHSFQNPTLQTLWAAIEAIALEMPNAREIEDTSVPKFAAIEEKLKKLSLDFSEIFSIKDTIAPIKAGGKTAVKRTVGETRSEMKAKQAKNVDIDIEELAKLGKVDTLKVDQLKAYLIPKGLKVTGLRKKVLVDLVYKELDVDAQL